MVSRWRIVSEIPFKSYQDLNSFLNSELVIGESGDDFVDRGTNWILGFKNEKKITEGEFSFKTMNDKI